MFRSRLWVANSCFYFLGNLKTVLLLSSPSGSSPFFFDLHILFTDHWDWVDYFYFMRTLRLGYIRGYILKGPFHPDLSCFTGQNIAVIKSVFWALFFLDTLIVMHFFIFDMGSFCIFFFLLFFIYFTYHPQFLLSPLFLFHPPTSFLVLPPIYSSERGRPPIRANKTWHIKLRQDQSSSSRLQGWTRLPTIGSSFQRASSCTRHRSWTHC